MDKFVYMAPSSTGDLQEKQIQAEDINQAKLFLKRQGIQYISIAKFKSKSNFLNMTIIPQSVKPQDIIAFSQLFSSVLEAGFSVKDSLSLLAKQLSHPVLIDCVNEILVSIQGGTVLSVAFAKHVPIFPSFYPAILKTGEASGDLAGVLKFVTEYLESVYDIQKELKGMLTYPIVVVSIAFLLVSLVVFFVAPTFKGFFSNSKFEMPLPSKILFGTSDLFSNYGVVIFFALIFFVGLFILLYKTPSIKKRVHYYFMKLPLVGNIFRQMNIVQFLKIFNILITNKVPMLQTLSLIEQGTNNLYFRGIVSEMREDASKGLPVSSSLVIHSEVVPSIVSYAISMGEKSGTLSLTLSRMSTFSDRELLFLIKNLSAKVNPILTLLLGGVVIFVAMAIYMPLFKMMMNLG